jgi:uncharacterized protein YabN with tetrapyrrole methylase and pyrophosphatase domain
VSEPGRSGEALARLDEITRRLRVECPWDREQDERSIVPHTVEEAYELADAANRGDDGKLLDELGDVLFQVVFLSLLLEERGAGDFAAVAEHCRQKLIRRHPHVFGDTEVSGAADVLRNWDQIKTQLESETKNTAVNKWVSDVEKEYKDKVQYAAGFEPPDTSTTTGETTTTSG